MNKALEFQEFVALGTIRASTTQEIFMPTKTETATPQLCRAFLGTGETGAKGRLKLNADIAVAGAPIGLTPADIEAAIVATDYHVFPDTTVTVCLLTLRNGAKVIGHNYGSIDPSRQNWEMGKQAARVMAVEKVWELEGYVLRERLAGQPKAKIHICGVTCHKGDENCNGYCIGSAPRAKPFDLEES